MMPGKLSKMYKGRLSQCGKCEKHKTFYNALWTCEKAMKCWIQIHTKTQRILKINIAKTP